MNSRHDARHNTLRRASVLPGRCAPQSDGWLGGVGHGVVKRSHSLERPGGLVSSSLWEAACFFMFWPPVRAHARMQQIIFLGGRTVKHQRSFGVRCYTTFMSVDVLKYMNGNQSFVIVFGIDRNSRYLDV